MRDYNYGRMIIANINFLANKVKQEEKLKRQGLQTVGCYEMLAQPRYKRKLQYVPFNMRKGGINETSLIQQEPAYVNSETVRYYLDLPYLKNN